VRKPDALLTNEVKGAPYYGEYQEHIAKYQQYLDAEHGKAKEGGATESPKATKVTKPKAAKATKPAGDKAPKPAPTQPSKAVPEKSKNWLWKLLMNPHRRKDQKGPARPVVIREPDSRRIQPLPDVQRKGKEKRRTPMPTEASGLAKSPSLDAKLALTDNETEYDNVVPKINTGDQNEGHVGPNPGNRDEGQAGPNPGVHDEGQAGSNPGDVAKSQPQSSYVVHVGPNLEHIDLEAINALTQQNPEQINEEFTTTAYPNVQENLKLPSEDQMILEKPASSTGTLSSLQNLEKELSFTDQFFIEKHQEEEPGKTNTKAEVQSLVLVPIHQDTSSVPPMTTLVIDLTTSQSGSPLPTSTATTSEILQQRMFEDKSYEAHDDHKKLYDALEKTPSGSPPSPPPPPLAGVSGALGTSGASGSSQLHSPPSPSYSASQSMARTTSDTRYESTGVSRIQELSFMDSLIQDDSIPDEQVHLSDDEDSGNDHPPKADSRKDWWKPLPKKERPATPELAWTIPSSHVSDVENNWATVLVSNYKTPAENTLLATTRDMMNFLNLYCRQVNKTELTQADLEGQAYEVVKAFYPDVIHLQFQMEECHKMLTDQVDWMNPEGDQIRVDVNRPLPLGGPPGHVTIQSQFFFNKDLEYLRYGSKGSSHALSISKMKAASYLDFGLELLVPKQMWIDDVVDLQEHTIAEKDFKNLYPSDFKDLNLLLLQGHLDHLLGFEKRMLSAVVKLWTRNLVIRQRVEDFQLGIESYQTQLNLTKPGWDATCYEFKHDYTIIESPQAVVFPSQVIQDQAAQSGYEYAIMDSKDVTRSKEFIAAIVRRLKTRRIYQNLECFVGGRVRDIDYRLLQRTE
nr:hypothetical protein [Tanacetum cinerariifolium]